MLFHLFLLFLMDVHISVNLLLHKHNNLFANLILLYMINILMDPYKDILYDMHVHT
jgi:hypothetical protein